MNHILELAHLYSFKEEGVKWPSFDYRNRETLSDPGFGSENRNSVSWTLLAQNYRISFFLIKDYLFYKLFCFSSSSSCLTILSGHLHSVWVLFCLCLGHCQQLRDDQQAGEVDPALGLPWKAEPAEKEDRRKQDRLPPVGRGQGGRGVLRIPLPGDKTQWSQERFCVL